MAKVSATARNAPDPANVFADQGSIIVLAIARDKFCQQLMTCDSSPRAWEEPSFQKTLAFCTAPTPTARVVSKKNSTTLPEVCGIFANFAGENLGNIALFFAAQ